MGTQPQGIETPSELDSERLDSWKDIANYLKRQVRTVNLWEKTEGLPVHRHVHSKRGTVYAYKSELNAWREQRALPSAETQPGIRRSRMMIVVLPFRNLSGDATQDYFSDGLTEEMISQLGRISPERLGVIARTSAMHYKNFDRALSDIGSELGVEYVLEGSVRRCGERVRITSQLVRVSEQLTIWSQSYDRELADILLLQTEVASRIANAIAAELESPSSTKPPTNAKPTSKDAYEAYLRARNYWNQRTEESLLKSVHYFGQAVAMDPKLALAYSGLGDAYNLLAVYGVLPSREAMPLARDAALRALEINPELGEAHACLGDVKSFYEWDWNAASHEYQQALSFNPSYATAHHFYAYYLAAVGRHEEALAEIELARSYDPHSVIISVWKGILLRLAGAYEDAVETCCETAQNNPEYVLARWALGLAYESVAELGLASAEFEAAVARGPNPGMLAALAYSLGVQGQTDRALQILKQLHELSAKRYVPAYDFATVYLGLGNEDQTLHFLDKAFQERSAWIVTLPIEPRMQRLRANVLFRALVGKLRLPSTEARAAH